MKIAEAVKPGIVLILLTVFAACGPTVIDGRPNNEKQAKDSLDSAGKINTPTPTPTPKVTGKLAPVPKGIDSKPAPMAGAEAPVPKAGVDAPAPKAGAEAPVPKGIEVATDAPVPIGSSTSGAPTSGYREIAGWPTWLCADGSDGKSWWYVASLGSPSAATLYGGTCDSWAR